MSNILIGVSGSISAYRMLDVARGLVKAGHAVRIMLTKGATEFVVPQVFSFLGSEAVYMPQDDFRAKNVLHVELAKWADRIVIAPLSANTLAKLANGMADDLLTSVVLAKRAGTPLLLYPAMNTFMWNNSIVQENLARLEKHYSDVFIHPPAEGELVCGDEGQGKLPSVEALLDTIPFARSSKDKKAGAILITTGATVAPLDPVRFLTNPSSGLTGLYLAQLAHAQGHSVTLLYGRYSTPRIANLKHLSGIKLLALDTPDDFLNAMLEHWPDHSVYISAAAIGDILFKESEISQDSKLKKSALPEALQVTKAPDVLARAIAMKKTHQKLIGFAAETHLTEEILLEKLRRKPVDLLVGTKVHSGQLSSAQRTEQGFKAESAQYSFYENGKETFNGTLSKIKLAQEIMHKVESWLN